MNRGSPVALLGEDRHRFLGGANWGCIVEVNGTPAGNPLEVQLMAAPSATDDNTGCPPSDPTLYSTVGSPSALQSIVTLNVTNTTGLDLLLAGLLDNTTGGPYGVNGTFQSVTTEVGSLGLAGAVVGAIPNAVVASEGLYGPPSNNYQPTTGGFWGTFWNAVSAVVTNPLGTVLSLVDTVWNAGTAAFTYLNRLTHEAAAIGAEVIARTAASIVHVGEILIQALDELKNWIIQEVTELVSPVITALASADLSYTGSLASDVQNAINDTSGGHSLPVADATKYWKDFSGSIFLLAVTLATAIDIILWLVMGLSLGAEFIVGVVVSLALLAALRSLLNGSPIFDSGDLDGVAAFSAGSIWLMTSQLNHSSLGPTLRNNSDYLAATSISAGTVSDLVAGASLVTALAGIILLSVDAAAVLGLILAIVGIFTALAAQHTGNFFWGEVSVVTDIESLAVDFTSLRQEGGATGANGVLNGVSLFLDTISTIIDFKTALRDGP